MITTLDFKNVEKNYKEGDKIEVFFPNININNFFRIIDELSKKLEVEKIKIYVNLTIVTSTYSDENPITTYEIEAVLEINSSKEELKKSIGIFFKYIENKLIPIIQNTVEIYKLSEKNTFIKEFNDLICP